MLFLRKIAIFALRITGRRVGDGPGEMPEWSIGPHSKCGVRVTVPGVRIPLFPPDTDVRAADSNCGTDFFCTRGLRGALIFVSCSLTDMFYLGFLSVAFQLLRFLSPGVPIFGRF